MKKILLLPLLLIPMFFFHNSKPVTAVEATYAPYQVVNGGFESGNLAGWTRYDLWKNESDNQAFDPSLVTNGTYFGENYPYNRDGNYCLGITSGSVTWSQTDERMGFLRSSDFTLGGTGWISFKLGGGQVPDFAYMSVLKSSDNTEVARFGNRWFNDGTRRNTVYGSDTGNAEFFLFPYYFNLSTVTTLGTGLYILLCDTAGYNKSLLSADSFVTYYATAPTGLVADDLATNIVPTIQYTGAFTQANLTNLSGSLDKWTNVDNIWKTDSGFCRSDNTNDAALGVLRSSAFTITPDYDHIRMGWGGRLMADKQIFMSIKEVGSNIEMLRILRRSNLSGYADGGRQGAKIDLTFLNATGKEYYLEISDNTTDGYGLNFVDSVRFVTDGEYDGVPVGDQVTYLWSGAADDYHSTGMADSFPDTTMTSTQEAQVMAGDFLEQTASYCAATNGGAMDASGTWTALSNQYGAMSNAAKDDFYNNTADAVISAAQKRYLNLIRTYSSLSANSFVVNSSDTPYSGAENNISSFFTSDKTSLLIMLLGGTALAAFSFLFFKRKRQVQ